MLTTDPRPQGPAVRDAAPRTKVRMPSRDETGKLILPNGAVSLAWHHAGADGRTVKARFPVPVNDAGEVTHVEWHCRSCPGSTQWFSARTKITPLCGEHETPLKVYNPKKQPTTGSVPWASVGKSQRERGYVAGFTAAVAGVGVALDAINWPWYGDVAQFAAIPACVAGSWWLTRAYLAREEVRLGRLDPADKTGGKRVRDRIAKRARNAAYLAALAGLWVELADVVNVDLRTWDGVGAVAAVMALGVAGSRPYLRWVDARRNRPQPAAAPVPVPTTPGVNVDAQRDADHWAGTVAVVGGLAGTAVDLSTWKADPGGRSMVVRNDGRRGALTDEKMKMALPLIAGAFDVSLSAIGWVTEHEGSPNAVKLLVQPNSPLNDTVPGEPVDVVPVGKAVVHMGKRIDGTPLVTRLFTPGWGAPSRVFLGSKGAGKTEALRRLMLVQLKARIDGDEGLKRLVAPFLHDPKRGADYGAFRRQVCGFSIDSDTLHMIVEAFIREMDRRYDALAGVVWIDEKGREREGERPFDPYTMGPVLSLTMDEFHVDAKDAALMAKFDPMARKMRAAGIEINFATHLATIGDTGSQGFRDMVAGGEAWLLRTTLGMNAALATGGTLSGDPRLLPRVPGMVLQSSGEDVTMQARVAYDEKVYDLMYDDDNQSLIHPVVWPQETLDAFGPEMVEWMRASQERPLGSAAVAAPQGYRPAGSAPTSAEDRRAFDALLEILSGAETPLRRPEIMGDPRWSWATKTLTNCLRSGQDGNPPVVEKVDGSNGAYRLTTFGREWASLEGDRKRALAEERSGE